MGAKASLPYDIGEEYARNSVWKLHRGVVKSNNQQVTIFVCNIKENSTERVDYARNSLKRSKILKHPSFITFIDGGEVNDMIYIVTERVTLLPELLTNSFVEIGFTELLAWGLYQVLQGLLFIHSRLLYHGNINKQSIYVDHAGEMKIGELGFLFDLSSGPNREPPSVPTFPLRRFNNLLDQRYKAPEVVTQKWEMIEQYPVALDAYGLGCLIYEIFEKDIEYREQIKVVTKVPKPLVVMYHNLVNDVPTARLKITEMPYCPYFARNNMIETQIFLDNIAVKDQAAIETFIMHLPEYLESLPRTNCKFKIFPKLLDAIKYGPGAAAQAITSIFKIGGMFNDPNEYREHFLMRIIVLFDTSDDSVRMTMLQNLNTIVPHLSIDIVEKNIYCHAAKGFASPNPVVREATVKAMIELVPKLSEKTIEEDVVKYLWNLQTDKEPGIRTNTVIALGKLSKYFSPTLRQKLLLPAFARTLKDPFVPSRVSSLKAMLATKEYYGVRDIATKIIPVVSPLSVDPVQDVRDLAVHVLKSYLEMLTTGISQGNIDGVGSGAADQLSSSSSSGGSGGQQGGDWASWAMSSVSSIKNKIVGGENASSQQQVGSIGSQSAAVAPSYGGNNSGISNVSNSSSSPSVTPHVTPVDPFEHKYNAEHQHHHHQQQPQRLDDNSMNDLIQALQDDNEKDHGNKRKLVKKPKAAAAQQASPSSNNNNQWNNDWGNNQRQQQQQAAAVNEWGNDWGGNSGNTRQYQQANEGMLLDISPSQQPVKPKSLNELKKERAQKPMNSSASAMKPRKKQDEDDWASF